VKEVIKGFGNCPHLIRDGAGHYCQLKDMRKDEDYPHSWWRVLCYGRQEHPNCIKPVTKD